MKKVFMSSLFAGLFAFNASAGVAEVFEMDENFVNSELAQLNELDEFIAVNEGITLSEMDASNGLLAELNGSSDILRTLELIGRGDPPLGIPSFLWGACFGVAGIAIVYFVTDDRDETKKALTGCAIVQGAIILLYVVIWVIILGGAAASI
ncbi:MAG: hypothetical protein ACK4GL_02235 [Flavobacteriales bacterium]